SILFVHLLGDLLLAVLIETRVLRVLRVQPLGCSSEVKQVKLELCTCFGAALIARAPVLCARQVSSILPASTYRHPSRLHPRHPWNDRATYHACLQVRAIAHSSRFVPTRVRYPERCRSNPSVECLAGQAASPPSNLPLAHDRPAPG